MGPTASGKTRLACQLSAKLKGEIISADSRQVYKQLNIGTGKDLDEYIVEGKQIPYHLVDLVEPGEQFYLHQFVEQLEKAFTEITSRKKIPIICGGTGLYLDALTKDLSFTQIKENQDLRADLEILSKEVLLAKLSEFPADLVKHVDVNSKKRIIRGIEVAEALVNKQEAIGIPIATGRQQPATVYKPYYLGVKVSLEERKEKITKRLLERLNSGLIEEVEGLLKSGLSHERLQHLGLEYKFVSFYLLGTISKELLFTQLQTAIFQFAKRQMTWFRKMEKEGIEIHWLEQPIDVNDLFSKLRAVFKE